MMLINKYLTAKLIFKQIFIPIILLILYCGSCAYAISQMNLEGVNSVFAYRLAKLASIGLIIVSVAIFVAWIFNKNASVELRSLDRKVMVTDFLLLLFPLMPISQYTINNRDLFSLPDLLLITFFFIMLFAVYIIIIPASLRKVSSVRTLMSLGLAFAFSIASMASLTEEFSWFGFGSLKIQLVFFGFVFLASWLLLGLKSQKDVYILAGVFFVAISIFQLLSSETRSDVSSQTGENQLYVLAKENKPISTPNIYLLVYDSYVQNETMLAYGIDNSAQEEYLQGQGFALYPHTYSVGSATFQSMGRVLDITTTLPEDLRKGVSGDSNVHNVLKTLGYKTLGLFPYSYMFLGTGSSYDISIPENVTPVNVLLISSILMGEFRFDIGSKDQIFQDQTYDQFVKSKLKIINSNYRKQVFVYSHTVIPNHSQNSGVCLPDEIELYENRLAKANQEMRQDVEAIIKIDPDAIIIVAGDHGPYLTKNCTYTSKDHMYTADEISRIDIQDRFGAFLAIRWPTEEYSKYDDIKVLQDIFPVIFAYLYDDPVFLTLRIPPNILQTSVVSGVKVIDGIIFGGIDDGGKLYLSDK